MDAHSLLRRVAGPALQPIVIFDTITIIALVVLMFSVLVAWFSGFQRVKTWYLLQLTSAGYCASFLLLLGQQTGPPPGLQYCAISAALIYSAPPAVAAAALFFVIELHLRLSSVLFSRSMSDTFIYWVAWGIPLSHGVAFWTALLVGLSDTSRIQRDPSGIYCHIVGTRLPSLLAGTMVILFLGSMLLMEVITIIHLVQQRAAVRAVRVRSSDFPLGLFIRTVLYSVSGGFGIVMVDVVMNVSSAFTVILLAVIPLSVAVVFGTQMELLRAVFLCQFGRNKVQDGSEPLTSEISPV